MITFKLPVKIQPTEYYQITSGDELLLCQLPDEHAIQIGNVLMYEKFVLGPNATMTLYGIGYTRWTATSILGDLYFRSTAIYTPPKLSDRIFKWFKDFTPYPGG